MTEELKNKRIAQLFDVCAFVRVENRGLTVGEKILVNQERAHLMRNEPNPYRVPQKIEVKVVQLTKYIKETFWQRPPNYI